MINKDLKKEKILAERITKIENGLISINSIKKENKIIKNKSVVIGITGPPGAGKSTIIDLLISVFRKEKKKIAVLAIDPSSVKTKGAFLGDRIRMQKHSTDAGVFIRSLASRGHFGGLSPKTKDIVELFKIENFDYIIVETVGVGQTETEIVKVANMVITITTPASGDEIQILKAGVLELSDIIVLNKCDNEEADHTFNYLSDLSVLISNKNWKVPVIKMTANSGSGLLDLINSIERKMKNEK